MRSPKAFLIAVLLLLTHAVCFAWEGRVVGTHDGDTITVMHDGRGERVRFYAIDCPESSQAFGKKAKQYTSGLVFGKTVSVEPVDTDRYGRTVGIVTVDGVCVNQALVSSGLAWVYRAYCKSAQCAGWIKLEKNARNSHIGLWSEKSPVAPWEYRRQKRDVSLEK